MGASMPAISPIFHGDLAGRLHVRGVKAVTAPMLLRCLTAYLTGHWSWTGNRLAEVPSFI